MVLVMIVLMMTTKSLRCLTIGVLSKQRVILPLLMFLVGGLECGGGLVVFLMFLVRILGCF